MVAMLTIGMLGGMSWESSVEYYRLVNEFVRDRLGGLHSASCVLVSVDFAEIEQLQATGAWDKAAAVLARAARQVEAGGADLLVLCTNAMHKVAAQVQAAVTIPLLDLADVTAKAVHAIIYHELCQGIVLDSSRDRYREVITRLTAAGAQGVILGCTEIELLVTQADSPVPVFPTTRLHAQAAVERALAPVVTRS
jgi:aspartate racemase